MSDSRSMESAVSAAHEKISVIFTRWEKDAADADARGGGLNCAYALKHVRDEVAAVMEKLHADVAETRIRGHR